MMTDSMIYIAMPAWAMICLYVIELCEWSLVSAFGYVSTSDLAICVDANTRNAHGTMGGNLLADWPRIRVGDHDPAER